MIENTKTRLETIVLKIFNRRSGRLEKIRCFLDTGSNRSFVTKSCAEQFNLDIADRTHLYVSVFGKTAKKLQVDVTKVQLFGDKLEPKCEVDLCIIENLLSDLNSYELSPRQQDFLSCSGFSLADPDAGKNGKLKIDVLLGQDCARLIANGETIVLPGGSLLVPTWDGRHILSGPLDKWIGKYKTRLIQMQWMKLLLIRK